MFILIYILACVLFLPGSLLTLGAGVLFGVMRGAVIVSIASTLGATAAFLVGRLLARDWVAKRIQTKPKFKAIDEAVAVEGWKIVGQNALFLGRKKLSALTVPWCTYTDPEIAHVGLSEREARERG